MIGPVTLHRFFAALATVTTTRTGTTARPHVKIRAAKWMATRTVGLPSISSNDRVSSEHVLAHGYWFKVARVDAEDVATQVVDRQTARNGAYEKFVSKAMRNHPLVARDPHAAVAVSQSCSSPVPATILLLLDSIKEVIAWIGGFRPAQSHNRILVVHYRSHLP